MANLLNYLLLYHNHGSLLDLKVLYLLLKQFTYLLLAFLIFLYNLPGASHFITNGFYNFICKIAAKKSNSKLLWNTPKKVDLKEREFYSSILRSFSNPQEKRSWVKSVGSSIKRIDLGASCLKNMTIGKIRDEQLQSNESFQRFL